MSNTELTPYLAALGAVGRGVTARIERFKFDGGRCGLAQGRHAAWNWAYRVHVPGEKHPLHGGRGLIEARQIAATLADTITEDWTGGSVFLRGPLGGLKRATESQALVFAGVKS